MADAMTLEVGSKEAVALKLLEKILDAEQSGTIEPKKYSRQEMLVLYHQCWEAVYGRDPSRN